MSNPTNTALAAEYGELNGPSRGDSLSTSDRICAVMSEIATRVPHDAKFGYEYTTADAMYELLRPLLAKHGLVLRFNILDWTEETITPRSGKQVRWANIKAEFSFNDDDPEVRMQGVPLYGPQGYGAAVTYMQKYWLRGKLFLATGEGDVDGIEPVAPPVPQRTKPTPRRPQPRPNPPQQKTKPPQDTKPGWLVKLEKIAGRTGSPQLCGEDRVPYNTAAQTHLKSGAPDSLKQGFVDQYDIDRDVAKILLKARKADEGTLTDGQRERVESLFTRDPDLFVVDAEAVALSKALKGMV